MESHLGSMCECGGWIGFIPEVHGCDQTVVHSEYVENLAVRKNVPLQALDELVDPDAGFASVFPGQGKRFDMGIKLAPLPSPSAWRDLVAIERGCRS